MDTTLIVKLADYEPLIMRFKSAEAAKIADRSIQRMWNNEYVSSKIVYEGDVNDQ